MNINARSPSLTSQESYAAVIIADLVADVPIQAENEPKTSRSSKEVINLAYDRQMDGETRPAVVKVETELVKMHSNGMKMNGSGNISKGVILNAVQFGTADANVKSGEKPIQLMNTLSTAQPIPEPAGFKDMSFLRKIAFAFSFLPSVLFVLCFAIILPCKVPSPCVEEMWIQTFQNAEATSNLILTPNIAFTLLEEDENYLMTLNSISGEVEKQNISANPTYMNCGKVTNKNDNNCIVMDEAGKIHVLNSSHGEFLWDPVIKSGQKPTPPVILPDCDNDGIEEIAVAISNTQMKILTKANVVFIVDIRFCDTMPTHLIPWTRNDSTDIVFVCKKEGKDTLVKVPQKDWCYNKEKSSGGMKLNVKIDSSRGHLLHPTEEGLIMWTGDHISMLLPDGEELWKFSNDTHSDKNRFIVDGKFTGDSKQIALVSSDISSTLQITLLNASDGTVMKTHTILNSEVTELFKINGAEKDFTLIIYKKMTKSAVHEALEHINGISTTIVSYISNEELNDAHIPLSNGISEEIAFWGLDDSFHSIKALDFSDKQGTISKASMTATHTKENMLIYYLFSSSAHSTKRVTQIKSIKVINWDISATKASECALK